jgi:hypothetical protein
LRLLKEFVERFFDGRRVCSAFPAAAVVGGAVATKISTMILSVIFSF